METTDNLYAVAELAATSEEKAIAVHSQPCTDFHYALVALQRAVRDADLGQEYAHEVGFLKRFRFLLCSTILPPKMIYDLLSARRLSKKSGANSLSGNPDIRGKSAEVDDRMGVLCELAQNPLLPAFLHHVPSLNTPAVAAFHVPDASFAPVVQKYIHETKDLRVSGVSFVAASANELRGPRIYDLLVFCGVPQWLEYTNHEYVLTAARAPEVVVVCYSFMISSSLEFSPVELESSHPKTARFKFRVESEGDLARESAPIAVKTDSAVTLEDVIPSVNLDAAAFAARLLSTNALREEEISARLWLLADNSAVYLEEPGEAWMLEPKDSGDGCDIQLRPNEALEPGQIIILTTSGAGDLIVPVANEMLGQHSDRYRNLQLDWKQRLRDHVSRRGLKAVLNELQALNAENLSEQNLTNWSSSDERKIGPGSDRTFYAVLQIVGLASSAEEIVRNAHTLRAVRISAGHYLQRQLLAEFQHADLEVLRTTGAFEVRTSDGVASKTAYLLEERGSDLQPILMSRRSKPFQVTEELWR
jgi:hypothetical protein